jgi:hypothetical protein
MFTLGDYITSVFVGILVSVMICNIIEEIDNRKK